MNKRKPGQWSKKYPCCQQCGTTSIRYGGKGYCRKCYCHILITRDIVKNYPSQTPEKIRLAQKHYLEHHPEHRINILEYKKRYRQKYPEKNKS
jgi:hypothetical protein